MLQFYPVVATDEQVITCLFISNCNQKMSSNIVLNNVLSLDSVCI